MTTFRVPPGGKITVGVEGEKPRTESKPADSRFVGADPVDDPLYVFRKAGVKLYDLGMVLNEAGNYDELEDTFLYDISADLSTGPSLASRQAFALAERAKYLAGDPTGVTEGKPNRKPIDHNSHNLWIDVIQTNATGAESRAIIGEPNTRAYLADIFGSATPVVPTTNPNWNAGVLKAMPGIAHLRVETFNYFLDLNTEDLTWMKITDGPTFESDEIAFNPTGIQGIYLVPKTNQVGIFYVIGASGSATSDWQGYSDQRISRYAGYELLLDPFETAPEAQQPPATKTALTNRMVESGVYNQAISTEAGRRAYLELTGPDHSGRMFISNYLSTPWDGDPDEDGRTWEAERFRGIIKTSARLYYLWERFPVHGGTWYTFLSDRNTMTDGFTHGVITENEM